MGNLSQVRNWDYAVEVIGGCAAAALAVMACFGVYSVTGSNRGLATVLGFTIGLSSLKIGWRAGFSAAVLATVLYDLLLSGKPYILFLDTPPNHYMIYLGFFGWATIGAAQDIPWLRRETAAPAVASTPNDLDLTAAIEGEADAYKLIQEAKDRNAPFLITAKLSALSQGPWTQYKAGFAYAVARSAVATAVDTVHAPLMPLANDNPNDVEAYTGVIPADTQVLAQAIWDEQMRRDKNAQA